MIFRDRCLACPCGIGKRGTHIAHKSHVAEQPTRGVWLLRSVEPRVAKRKKRFACRSIPIRRVRSRPRRSLLIHALHYGMCVMLAIVYILTVCVLVLLSTLISFSSR